MTTPEARERRLRRGGLDFFGRISASISHEFNNVITIIGEVSGLLDDLCLLAERGRPISPERLRKQCDLIAKQTARAQKIIRGMNHLAHSVDSDVERFDLDEEIQATVTLTERLAGLKGFSFESQGAEEAIEVEGQRFLFHELLFVLFRSIFEGGAEGGVIEIQLDRASGAPEVAVAGALPDAPSALEAQKAYAALLAEELGGALTTRLDEAERVTFTLRLPATA